MSVETSVQEKQVQHDIHGLGFTMLTTLLTSVRQHNMQILQVGCDLSTCLLMHVQHLS